MVAGDAYTASGRSDKCGVSRFLHSPCTATWRMDGSLPDFDVGQQEGVVVQLDQARTVHRGVLCDAASVKVSGKMIPDV